MTGIRDQLKADFGYDIPVSGGFGTEDDPFVMDGTDRGRPTDVVGNCHFLAKVLLSAMGAERIEFQGNLLTQRDGQKIEILTFAYLKPPYGDEDKFTKRYFFKLPSA